MQRFTYSYDCAGRRTSMRQSADGAVTTWLYDPIYHKREHRTGSLAGFHVTHVYDPANGGRAARGGSATSQAFQVKRYCSF